MQLPAWGIFNWLRLRPRVFEIVENGTDRFRLRVDEPSDHTYRIAALGGLILAGVAFRFVDPSPDLPWDEAFGYRFYAALLTGAMSFLFALRIGAFVPFLRRSYELVLDPGSDQILKRTQSKVLPEVGMVRLSELRHVRLAHVTRQEAVTRWGGAQRKKTKHSYCILYKKRDDHPDSADTMLVHSELSSDIDLLRLVAGRVSEFSQAELVEELD